MIGFRRQPLAAFVLGHHAYAIRIAQRRAWENPLKWGVDCTLRRTLQEYKQALMALENQIQTNRFNILRDAWNQTDACWLKIVTPPKGDEELQHRRTLEVPGTLHWKDLRDYSDGAIKEDDELRRWLALGIWCGKSLLAVLERRKPDDSAAHLIGFNILGEPVPSEEHGPEELATLLIRIVNCATALRRLPRVSKQPELKEVLAVLAKVDQPTGSGPDCLSEAWGPSLERTRARLQDALKAYRARSTPGREDDGEGGQIPRWNREQGKLWLGEVLLKEFRDDADNVKPVLDAFEKAGWESRIECPFPPVGPVKERMENTRKSLNKKLKRIRFRIKGSGFTWELVPGN
jgi:hypothetical protein